VIGTDLRWGELFSWCWDDRGDSILIVVPPTARSCSPWPARSCSPWLARSCSPWLARSCRSLTPAAAWPARRSATSRPRPRRPAPQHRKWNEQLQAAETAREQAEQRAVEAREQAERDRADAAARVEQAEADAADQVRAAQAERDEAVAEAEAGKAAGIAEAQARAGGGVAKVPELRSRSSSPAQPGFGTRDRGPARCSV